MYTYILALFVITRPFAANSPFTGIPPYSKAVNFGDMDLPAVGSFSVFEGFYFVGVEDGAGEEVGEGGAEGDSIHGGMLGVKRDVQVLTVEAVDAGAFVTGQGRKANWKQCLVVAKVPRTGSKGLLLESFPHGLQSGFGHNETLMDQLV